MEVFISHINPEAPLASVLKKWIEDAFPEGVKVSSVVKTIAYLPVRSGFEKLRIHYLLLKCYSLFVAKSQLTSDGSTLRQEQDGSEVFRLYPFVILV